MRRLRRPRASKAPNGNENGGHRAAVFVCRLGSHEGAVPQTPARWCWRQAWSSRSSRTRRAGRGRCYGRPQAASRASCARAFTDLALWRSGYDAVARALHRVSAGAAVEYSGRCVAVGVVRKGRISIARARCCARLSSGIGRRRAAGAGVRSLVERQMKLSCQSWLATASEARARAAGPPVARVSESGAPLPYPSRSRWSGASSGTPFDRHRALFG